MSGFRFGRDAAGNRIKIPFTQEEEAERERFLAPMRASHDAADRMGLGKNAGGEGECPCSRCKTGRIRFTVSSLNGHIWGSCSTSGCASWME